MKRNGSLLLYICGPMILLFGGFVAIAAAGEGKRQTKVLVVERSSDCEGEECEELKDDHHKIIIKCMGDGCEESDLSQHLSIDMKGIEGLSRSGHRWVSGGGEHFNFDFSGLHFGSGGFLGVELNELSPELRAHFGVPDDVGVMVSKVVPDSPAAKAGIMVGDIISAVDGDDIPSAGKLAREIRSREEGETVDLEIWRDGNLEVVSAGIEIREASSRMPRALAHHRRHGDGKKIQIRRLHADHDDFDFDCGDEEECVVIVECHDGGCDCTINGDTTDCEGIPGVPHQGE
jgi:hypothetical protein